MKLLAVFSTFMLIVLAAAIAINSATSGVNRCATGTVRGFAVVTGDPRLGGIGAILNRWYSDSLYFGIRYNCKGKNVLVRRIDEGVYDIWFPGNSAKVAQVTALISGASASAILIRPEVFRVSIRGPIVNNNVLIPKEAAFQITVA